MATYNTINELKQNSPKDLLEVELEFSNITAGTVLYKGEYNSLKILLFCWMDDMSKYTFDYIETVNDLLDCDTVELNIDNEIMVRT